MPRPPILLLALLSYIMQASAQFGFFDQMFGGAGGGGPAQHQHQHQQPQDVRSDSAWYRAQYEGGT